VVADVVDRRPEENIIGDIVVVGGGAAGVAAAVTAARQGFKTVLIERYGFCGGGAVAGLSGTVCGLYLAQHNPNTVPDQVVFGFTQEFVELLDRRGGLAEAIRYGNTYTRVHDPLVWREAADQVLTEAGVRVLYHALVTDTLLDGEAIAGVVVSARGGKITVRGSMVVDASGDAHVAAMAGLATTIGREGVVQNPTMIFRIAGVDVERFMRRYGPDTIMPSEVSALIRQEDAAGRYKLPRAKIFLFPTTRPGELLCNCTRIVGADGRELNPLRIADMADAELEGRRQMREYARFFRNHLEGCKNAWVNDTGVEVGVRQGRQITGIDTLTNDDVECARKRPDGIAKSAWPIELHKGAVPRVSWLLNDYYEVPYGCFVPRRGENILMAGRCLSAEHEAMASARVTAQCFAYGHAIGHAAAFALRERKQPRAIDGAELRQILNADGARLD
jgi:hypothetical protein